MKKWLIFLAATICIASSFFVDIGVRKISNHSNLMDFSYLNDNLYLLTSDQKNKETLSVVNSKGVIKAKKILDQPENNNKYEYVQFCVDNSGYIYLLVDEIKYEAEGGKYVRKGILNEKILMYDSNCNFVKDVTSVDFSGENTLSNEPYIYKIQINNDNIDIICRKGNNFEILNTNPMADEKPKSVKYFKLTPKTTVQDNVEWITDMAVLSQGKVAYGTRYGELFIMDDNENFQNVTANLGENVCPLEFSADDSNNLYFTEVNSENYYKLNASEMTLDLIYNQNSVINANKKVDLKSITYITCDKEGEYCAVSKDVDNVRYFVFGDTEKIISNVRDRLFPYRLIIDSVCEVFLFAIFLIIYLLYLKDKKRITLIKKIIFVFLPVYTISVIVLTFLMFKFINESYDNYVSDSQRTSAKIMLDCIDGDLFESVDPFSGYLSDSYLKLKSQVEKGYAKSNNSIANPNDYVFTYTVKDGKIYMLFSKGRDDFYNIKGKQLDLTRVDVISIPINYIMDEEEAAQYYDIWNSLSSGKQKNNVYVLKSNKAEWVTAFETIKNSKGQAVGFVGASVDKKEDYNAIYGDMPFIAIAVILAVIISIVIFFVIILGRLFKPLKEINNGMRVVASGRWNTQLNLKSRDEIYDVSVTFNFMVNKIRNFISEITQSNKIYEKFVPLDLISLMDRKSVVDIDQNVAKSINVNIVYVTFDAMYDFSSKKDLEKEYFKMMNELSTAVFDVARNNNGVVEWFDGMGVMAYFPRSPFDAVSALSGFNKAFENYSFKNNMKVMLSSGKIVIGIIKNGEKEVVSVVSNEVLKMNYVINKIGKVPLRYFALESIEKKLNKNYLCDYRFAGELESEDHKSIKIYEFIENVTSKRKSNYMLTKDMFESAVKDYIDGNLLKARKAFADVLKRNEDDKLAMYYLAKCDKNQGIRDKNWRGYIN